MPPSTDPAARKRAFAERLEKLLDEAAAAMSGDDLDARVTVQRKLLQFTRDTPLDASETLDDIARAMIATIADTGSQEAILAVQLHAAELARYVKSIDAVTAQAEADARSIRLERVEAVIGGTTALLGELRDLRATITTQAPAAQLAKRLDAAIAALRDLMTVTVKEA